MLAAAEVALIAELRGHRLFNALGLRTVSSVPAVKSDKDLVAKYAVDAPGFYLAPPTLSAVDDYYLIDVRLLGFVRNAAGQEQARRGDGKAIGADALLIMATKALHAHRIADADWRLVGAQPFDDDLFDEAGLAGIEMHFQSSRLELPADLTPADLEDFLHFHGDIDLPPLVSDAAHDKWRQDPPDYTTSRPELQLDETLEGASA